MFQSHTDITATLQSRIDELAASGGGEITIPPGEYTFRPIRLRSNICLNLQAGARLLASGNREDYAPIGYDHNEMGEVFSCIYAFDAENITVKGEGILDLNGETWYRMDEPKPITDSVVEITDDYLREVARSYGWRVNQPIFFHRCSNIRFANLTITNAPCWTLSFNLCHIVKVTDLTILNGLLIPNSDGMHFTCSRDILISGCAITAGDDCVALTGITDWGTPTENVTITNCVFQSASKAISIGYMHSIVRNVVIENVVIKKSNRALVIMCHPHTGCVENVRVSNCILEGRSYPGNWWGNGESIVIMATPQHIARYRDPMPEPRFDIGVRNIFFSQLICRAERPLAVIASEPLTRNIHFRDIQMEIVPEDRPSIKGNVIDLAPGPEHYQIPGEGIGMVFRNANPTVDQVTNEAGEPVVIVRD